MPTMNAKRPLARHVRCHYCDNRTSHLAWQSRVWHAVQLRVQLIHHDLPPASSSPGRVLTANHASTVLRTPPSSRLDRDHVSQSTMASRSNLAATPFHSDYSTRCRCNVRLDLCCEPATKTKPLSMERPSLAWCFFLLVLFYLSSLTVISTTNVQEARSPYSHPYSSYEHESRQIRISNGGMPPVLDTRATVRPSTNVQDRQYLSSLTYSGGEVTNIKVLRRQSTLGSVSQTPDYYIKSDIIVAPGARLEIEPGVRIAFAPQVGIVVRGSLHANGTSSSNITFTLIDSEKAFSLASSHSILPPSVTKPLWPTVRLVDGNLITEGRLQINYKGRWHSLCTNSRNWTQVDVSVVCRQLGFSGGHWYRWFARNNDTRQFMLENPGCRSEERAIQDCTNWPQRRIGSGVCDFHQDIGIRCDDTISSNHQTQQNYWKGIDFVHADSNLLSIMSNKMQTRISNSHLEHVIIEYAGLAKDKKLKAALSSYGSVPPNINELTIRRSAYTALNITDPVNGFQVTNSRFVENRGFGVYVNSSVGRVLLSSLEVEDNGADGVHFVHFDKSYYSADNFCQTPNLGTSQVFPIKYTHRQWASKAPTEECCQEFYAKDWEGQRITAHFPVLMSGIEDYEALSSYVSQSYMPRVGREGSIYVVDGHSGRIIADFFVRNDTKTQSVSSIIGNGPMRICYRPAHYRNVLFTVEVVVDYGREYDLVVVNSRMVANNGRGIWLRNLRSGAVVNRTLIAGHDYVAGLHMAEGVGELIVNNSVISSNLADGINITSGGGFLHVDWTEIVNNTNRGIAVWFNESIVMQSFNYSSHITRSSLANNRIGLFISGGCHFYTPLKQNAFWNVSMNYFAYHSEQALLYQSCVPRPRILKMQMKPIVTNVSITHNRFVGNDLHAIHMAPVFFAKVSIAHNEFTQHTKAVLYINSRHSFDVEKFVEDAERFPFSFYNNGHKLTNQRRLALDSWPAIVRIRNNNFNRNRGHYVASIGLLEPEAESLGINFSSLSQKVLFTRNVLHDNVVSEPFEDLNSRSRVAAVLCVTSSNVLVWRNEFVNPSSKYELGAHLSVHYRVINASLNYWGTSSSISNFEFDDKNLHSAALIYERIFDRKNRYNLAQVEFLPYILIANALESDRSALSLVNDREKILQFFSGSVSGEIGGQVKGHVNLPPGKYYVKRDIYISPEGELVLNPATQLFFDQSVGIFVQGKFKANGTPRDDIKFQLTSNTKRQKRAPIVSSNNNTSSTSRPKALHNKLNQGKLGHAPSYLSQSIRLSNGTEGRLEVRIGNEWGTVCGYNFDIEDASVACYQLGLVLNERDWRLERSEFWSPGNSRAILLSNVQCSHLDTDLTKCKSERVSNNDFEGGWCPMSEVGIRCFPAAWAGIRFGMLTQEAIIDSVTVENAGLLDYRTREFAPALQFDFNRFKLTNSIIRSNIDTGLGLLWNDVLTEPNDDILKINNCTVTGNLNHGIMTRTQGIQIKECLIADNKVSGFHYEPSFSREEQEELTSWIVRQQVHNRKVSVYVIPFMQNNNPEIYLGDIGRQIYVYVPRRPTPNATPFRLLIRTDAGKRIGVMAISPIFQTRSSESLRLYSPQLESSYIPKMMWDLKRNLTSFPFVYPGYRLLLEYSTGELPYGGVLLLFTPKQYLRSVPGEPTILEKGLLEQQQMNTMHIVQSEFMRNGKGLTSSHCSMNVDFNGAYCKRYGNETILLAGNTVSQSRGAGLFVNSHALSSTIPYPLLLNMIEFNGMSPPEFDLTYTSSVVAEINYTLIQNRFINNADEGSIVLYDHSLYDNGDMQRSSIQSMPGYVMSSAIGSNYPSNTNLFHWHISQCTLEGNRNGGLDIRLPYTWLYNENFTHTVVVHDSNFVRNHNFEFVIGGHYAKVNMTKNHFIENQCKIGLVSIRGMEKLMRIEENDISDNYVQKYVLELNMASHADKFGTVNAYIRRNVIRNNRYSGPGLRDNVVPSSSESTGQYTPETYAISIRGVQQVNVTRNILVNRNLQFELLAGVRAGSLQNELDARENWWGVGGDPISIRDRIFDFDDWNSFSTTIFSPWLSTDHLDSPTVFDQQSAAEDNFLGTPFLLGGRLNKSLVLHPRDRPYVVNTDLTVMPGSTLTLRPGVVIEFYPSVGILVLGDMAAVGLEGKPIVLRPFQRNNTSIYRSRSGDQDILFRIGSHDSSRNRRLVTTSPHTEQLIYSKSDHGGVRFCLTETCDSESEKRAEQTMHSKMPWLREAGYPLPLSSGQRRRHGFLEVYNTTTLQWTPVCDPRFTERNAQVVCRQLGFSSHNIFVRRGPRLDMDPTLTTRVNYWPEALECTGTESSLAECDLRTFSKDSYDKKSATYDSAPLYHSKITDSSFYRQTHYNFVGDNQTQELLFYLNDDWRILEERAFIQSTTCRHDGDEFIYIFCGEDNQVEKGEVSVEHWGGIRFALPSFEESSEQRFVGSRRRLASSTMQFVQVIGAGILHGEKSAAIQLIQRSVPLQFVNVTRSASHAVEVIAPPESLSFHRLQLRQNLGLGINLLLLGASSSESARVPYQPLGDGSPFSVPYNVFSLVDICDARKELRVNEKVIVYYKYDNRPVDCVKIFTSANPLKSIGLRFLQLNLWSRFVESEGRANEPDEDYLQGRKFSYQREDIFHNRIKTINDDFSESYVDASVINSMSDSLLIWDGDIFNETTRRLIGEVYSDSSKELRQNAKHLYRKSSGSTRLRRYAISSTKTPSGYDQPDSTSKTRLYKSSSFSLSIQLHASGASSRYGFIAEITTLPSAYYADRSERDFQHNITYSEIVDNTAGAILYRSVGESVPQVALLSNVIKGNCRSLWANFSTCENSAVQLDMQNVQHLYLKNNLVSENRAGGVCIRAISYTAVSALNADLINNLFVANLQKEALYFEGADAGQSYQTINVERNYFTRNRSPHRSNIVFGRAIVKFNQNIVINNYGDSQMFVAGFAHAQSSSKLQRCSQNFFYNNHASNERGEQSTIIVNTIGQIYTHNYLVNPENDFELSTRNRTIITSANHPLKQNILEPTSFAAILASAIVQAPNNWWGFNETSAVEARIRDSHDYYHLIPVEFQPFYMGNWSVLSGICYGGYEKIADTCFVYIGGRMTYHEARRFCEKDNSSMPFVRAANQAELTRYVYLQQPDFDRRRHPVWVQSFDVSIGACSVLLEGSVRVWDCNDELPFFCERDPDIGISTATLDFWYQEPLGMAAIGISLITALLSLACMCCWICKSRHRHLEKLERRNSIRASIRSSRSFASSMNTLNSDANYFTNRKLLHHESSSNVHGGSSTNPSPYRPMQPVSHEDRVATSYNNGSVSSTFSIFTDPNVHDERLVLTQKRYNGVPKSNIFNMNERESGTKRHTNANMIPPTFDLVFENQAFKGQSTPLSPASFSSRDDVPPLRAWTPDTNSTLDFKVKTSTDARELSQYTASSENLHKSIPSSASSASSSPTTELPSPASVLSRGMAKSQLRPGLRAPGHPPPPPPLRRLTPTDQPDRKHRQSMDPAILLTAEDNQADKQSTYDSEMLTFGAKKTSPVQRKPFMTDLDADTMGGSQPSLTYGSYRHAPSIATQESNMHYLETSLDTESFYNEAFDHASAKHASSMSRPDAATTQSQLYSSQPLETSM